jgi:hypothetical protein
MEPKAYFVGPVVDVVLQLRPWRVGPVGDVFPFGIDDYQSTEAVGTRLGGNAFTRRRVKIVG